jgi:hypothetical protein
MNFHSVYFFGNSKSARFVFFTAVNMKNAVFCDVTPCGCCQNRLFGGKTFRPHYHGEKESAS